MSQTSFMRIMGLNSNWEYDEQTEEFKKLIKILTFVVESKLDGTPVKDYCLDLFEAKKVIKSKYNLNVTTNDILIALDYICKENNYSIDIEKISVSFSSLPF